MSLFALSLILLLFHLDFARDVFGNCSWFAHTGKNMFCYTSRTFTPLPLLKIRFSSHIHILTIYIHRISLHFISYMCILCKVACSLRMVSLLPGNQNRILYFAPATALQQAKSFLHQACEGVQVSSSTDSNRDSGSWELLPMPPSTALSSHQLTDLLSHVLDYVAQRGGQTCTFVGSDTPDLPVHEILIGQHFASRSSGDVRVTWNTATSVSAVTNGTSCTQMSKGDDSNIDNGSMNGGKQFQFQGAGMRCEGAREIEVEVGGVMKNDLNNNDYNTDNDASTDSSRNKKETRDTGHSYICPAQDGGYVLLTLPLPLPLPLSRQEQPMIDPFPTPLASPSSSPAEIGDGNQHSRPNIDINSSTNEPDNSSESGRLDNGSNRGGEKHSMPETSTNVSWGRQIFSSVEWSSAQTLSTQVTALQACGLHVHIGHEVYTDMDEPADLMQLLNNASLYLSEVEYVQLLAGDVSAVCLQYISSKCQGGENLSGESDQEAAAALRLRFISRPSHTLNALGSISAEKLNVFI